MDTIAYPSPAAIDSTQSPILIAIDYALDADIPLMHRVVLLAVVPLCGCYDDHLSISPESLERIERACGPECDARAILRLHLGRFMGLDFGDPPEPRHRRTAANGRRALSAQASLAVFANDGYRCVKCGSRDNLTIDHIVPVVRGGTNDPNNLQTLCRSCNSRKGAR